jgi:hypothetical protein
MLLEDTFEIIQSIHVSPDEESSYSDRSSKSDSQSESEKEKVEKNKRSEAEDNVNKSESDSDTDSKSQAPTKHKKIERRKKRRTELKKLLKPDLIEKVIQLEYDEKESRDLKEAYMVSCIKFPLKKKVLE